MASDHPLASMPGPLSDDTLRNWPSLVRKTLREPYRNGLPGCWITKKGRRTGLGVIGNLPVGRTMRGNGADAFCPTVDRQRKMGGADVRESVSRCGLLRDVAANEASPALAWLLDYLGDSETLNREWLREPEEAPDSGD